MLRPRQDFDFARLNSLANLRATFYRFYPLGVPRDHLTALPVPVSGHRMA